MIKAEILHSNLANFYANKPRNFNKNSEFAKIYDDFKQKNDDFSAYQKKFEKILKEQDRMFKLFDLSMIYNQLMFGNNDSQKRSQLLQKSLKITHDLSKL